MSKRLIVNCVIACFVPAAAVACEGHDRLLLDQPAALEGVLKSGKGNHEAQGTFDYVFVALDKPVCVEAPPAAPGDEDAAQSIDAPVTQIQIAGDAVRTKLPIGKRVAIEGTLFAAHTMWHVEDVLIDIATVTLR